MVFVGDANPNPVMKRPGAFDSVKAKRSPPRPQDTLPTSGLQGQAVVNNQFTNMPALQQVQDGKKRQKVEYQEMRRRQI